MIPYILIAIIIFIITGLFLWIKLNKRIINIHELGNGIIANEYKNRVEVIDLKKIDSIKVNYFSRSLFNEMKFEYGNILNEINSIKVLLDNEIIKSCLAINIHIKSWKIESITIHNNEGNCTIFIDAPLNPEIKWGMEINVNLKNGAIESFEFCH